MGLALPSERDSAPLSGAILAGNFVCEIKNTQNLFDVFYNFV